MIITLNQREIKQAIETSLKEQGFATEGKKIDFTFTNGRKGNGVSVEIRITNEGTEADYFDDEDEDKSEVTQQENKTEEVNQEENKTSSIFN